LSGCLSQEPSKTQSPWFTGSASDIYGSTLSVIQDDADDWEEESVKMAATYEQAHISICEESSPGGDHTFLAPRSPGLDPIFLEDVFIDGYRESIKARRSRTGGMHVYQDEVPSAKDPLDRRGLGLSRKDTVD
jgi:hypothetical protein